MNLGLRTLWITFAIGAAGGANAQVINKTMASETTLNLANFASVNPDCRSRGEENRADHEWTCSRVIALREGPVFNVFPGRPNCNTREVHGVAVMYLPERGYVGSDSVNLDVIYPSGNERSPSYSITVK
jgi:hypothetical protein